MKCLLVLVMLCGMNSGLLAQELEITGLQDSYKGMIGDLLKVPLHFKNNSDKAITLMIRKTGGQIGSSQRNYFCQNDNCLEYAVDDIMEIGRASCRRSGWSCSGG